ncbi:MAG: dephospho-CoA kinase [Bacteroidales bacterium]|nr:dephospho-CoA kinase [Bacteroidales bacterium]
MVKIGLTGSIGSGKTIVAKIFKALEVPVYQADEEAKRFLEYPEVIDEIVNAFGNTMLTANKIDRKKLAAVVFSDPDKLGKLNVIIHPYVKEDFQKWCENHSDEPYVVQEAAILFESGFDKLFDKIITVSAPEHVRIERVMHRDSISKEDVLSRMRNQWSDAEKVKRADYVITNDEEQMIMPQVLDIHEELLEEVNF